MHDHHGILQTDTVFTPSFSLDFLWHIAEVYICFFLGFSICSLLAVIVFLLIFDPIFLVSDLSQAQLLEHILQKLPKVANFHPICLACPTDVLVGCSMLPELLSGKLDIDRLREQIESKEHSFKLWESQYKAAICSKLRLQILGELMTKHVNYGME